LFTGPLTTKHPRMRIKHNFISFFFTRLRLYCQIIELGCITLECGEAGSLHFWIDDPSDFLVILAQQVWINFTSLSKVSTVFLQLQMSNKGRKIHFLLSLFNLVLQLLHRVRNMVLPPWDWILALGYRRHPLNDWNCTFYESPVFSLALVYTAARSLSMWKSLVGTKYSLFGVDRLCILSRPIALR
jgi:hypothetical protein